MVRLLIICVAQDTPQIRVIGDTVAHMIPRATSHMGLRACNTLIGGKGGAVPSLLHTTLEGPMDI